MKKTLLFVALLCCTLWCAAQSDGQENVTENRQQRWTLGLVGGLARNHHVIDMSYMKGYAYDDYTNGYSAGARASFQLFQWLGFRTDVVLIQKNIHYVHTVRNSAYSFSTNEMMECTYVNMPLMVDLSVGGRVKLHGFAGGYAGYWLKAHRSGESYPLMKSNSNTAFDEDWQFNDTRDNRYDAGFVWGGGASAVLFKKFELFAEVRWYYGVLDIQKDYMRHLNPRYNTTMVIQGGVGYKL